MKIVVIGGSGLIGTKVVRNLRDRGHDVLPASPATGVDATTGKGLAEALEGAAVVVDVANSPSFEDAAVLAFFENSGRNLTRAEAEAGVKHHVALSVVGTERLQDSGYFRAKLAQETLIKASSIPYTIVRATQFFEFMGAIVQFSTVDGAVRLSTAAMQAISSEDVAAAVSEAALAGPVNGTIEIAGPERKPISEFVSQFMKATNDDREIIADPEAGYFGMQIDDQSLVPAQGAHLGTVYYADWLRSLPSA